MQQQYDIKCCILVWTELDLEVQDSVCAVKQIEVLLNNTWQRQVFCSTHTRRLLVLHSDNTLTGSTIFINNQYHLLLTWRLFGFWLCIVASVDFTCRKTVENKTIFSCYCLWLTGYNIDNFHFSTNIWTSLIRTGLPSNVKTITNIPLQVMQM